MIVSNQTLDNFFQENKNLNLIKNVYINAKIVLTLKEKKRRKPTKFPLTDEWFSRSTSTPWNRVFSNKKKKDETVDTHNALDESSGNYIVWGETYIKKLLVEGKDNQKSWF